jgi:hypothetical protein
MDHAERAAWLATAVVFVICLWLSPLLTLIKHPIDGPMPPVIAMMFSAIFGALIAATVGFAVWCVVTATE